MTRPEWLPLRKELVHMNVYGAPQLPSEAQLNTNENPYPPSPQLIETIAQGARQVAAHLNRYPDRDASDLRKNLADFLNEQSNTALTAHNIWAANGSNEIIQSLFLAFGHSGALGFTPSYSMHPLIAQVTRTRWEQGVRKDDFTIDIDLACEQIARTRPSLTFLTTPNNPTGTAIGLSDIQTLAQACARVGGLLVIDEAYAEFSSEASAITLMEKYPHLLVVRTMSKAFAFAGARVGYLAAHLAVIEAMFIVRLPYHLSALTQSAALSALKHRGELLATVSMIIQSRIWLSEKIESLGLRVLPSSANFLLFSVPDSGLIWQSLLDQGVLIRDVGLSGYLRVSVGTESENQKFITALKTALGGK